MMRRGVLTLGVVALLASNVTWAEKNQTDTKPDGKVETVKARTPDGRTFDLTGDFSKIQIIPSSRVKRTLYIPAKDMHKKRSLGTKYVDPSALYSNVTNFTGNAVINGGTAVYSSGHRTAQIADDTTLTFASSLSGYKACLANNNAGPTAIEYIIFHYDNTGAGGGPGARMFTYGQGWLFIDNTSTGGTDDRLQPGINCFYSDVSSSANVATTTGLWTDEFFLDYYTDSGGALQIIPVTTAEMDNLGVATASGPQVGTSTDNYWTAPSGGAANPAVTGTILALGAGENLAMEHTEAPPVPVSLQKFKAE